MDFHWDDDLFNDIDGDNGFNFDDGNESYSSEIYSDCSISSKSSFRFFDDANLNSTSENSMASFSSAPVQPVQPLTANQQNPGIKKNGALPRKRFGLSHNKMRFMTAGPTLNYRMNNMQLNPMNAMQGQIGLGQMRAPPPFFNGKIELAAMDQFKPRTSHRKIVPWVSSTPIAARTDQMFNDICLNPNATLNPVKLNFIPAHFWPNKDFSFADLVYDFFQRKNNTNCRFLHKLYNALKLSSVSQMYVELTGVQWITPSVIKVSKGQFARLLGIKSIDGSLFHQQGNFPTHGFIELNREQCQTFCPMVDLDNIDFDEIRILIHQPGLFVSNCNEMQVRACSSLVAQRRH